MPAERSSAGALVFDLGGVIVGHDNEVLFERLASGCSALDALKRIRSASSDIRYATGVLSMQALHKWLADDLGYRADWHAFMSDLCCHFTLVPSMLRLVEQLAAQNRVMLFSNTNQVHWDYLVGLSGGRLGRLEAYLSHEIGRAKPEVTAFKHVASLAKIDPAQSIFIDDLVSNVEGARAAGFNAHHFRTQADLEQFLREAGANWSI